MQQRSGTPAAEPLRPVQDPAGWAKDEVARATDWVHVLSAAEIADLDRAIARVEASGTDLADVGREQFGMPVFGPVLDTLREDIIDGRGFVLIRGVPVHRYSRLQSTIAFWGIGTYLGHAVSQNGKGHLLGHVVDLGSKTTDGPTNRGYHTAEMLPFHCDGTTDIVGLLCLHPAKSGGESALVSSITIYNEMLRRNPEYVAALSEPIYRDRRGEIPAGAQPYYALPVFNFHKGYLTTNWQGPHIRSTSRFAELPRHSATLTAALEMFENLAQELCFAMDFRQGDIQFLHNHVIVHSRTSAVEDFPEPERKRHLLRLRLMTPTGRPLPKTFFAQERVDIENVESGQRPSGSIIPPGVELKIPLEAE